MKNIQQEHLYLIDILLDQIDCIIEIRPNYLIDIHKNFPNINYILIIHNDPLHLKGSTSTKDRIMTQAAMVIHKELVDEGILPDSSPDEYYNELDSRIREEFPERFKAKRTKKIPTVISGTRSATGKNQVKLTKTEVDMANRLGVNLQDYARQKVRQQAGGQK